MRSKETQHVRRGPVWGRQVLVRDAACHKEAQYGAQYITAGAELRITPGAAGRRRAARHITKSPVAASGVCACACVRVGMGLEGRVEVPRVHSGFECGQALAACLKLVGRWMCTCACEVQTYVLVSTIMVAILIGGEPHHHLRKHHLVIFIGGMSRDLKET